MRGREVRADELLFRPPKDYNEVIKNIYGYLYNWYAVTDARRIANYGWRVPNRNDWISLIMLMNPNSHWNGNGWTKLENPQIFGLREEPQRHPRWDLGYTKGNNFFRLSLYPCSYRKKDGNFPELNDNEYLGKMGHIWTYSLGIQPHEGVLIKYTKNFIGVFGDPIKGYTDKRIGAGVRVVRNLMSEENTLKDGSFVDNYVGNNGMVYRAVKINNLVWITNNLIETKFRNNDDIPMIEDNIEWSEQNIII